MFAASTSAFADPSTLPAVLRAVVAGAATVVLIAGTWTIAQYVLAWWYHEDLSDRDTPANPS